MRNQRNNLDDREIRRQRRQWMEKRKRIKQRQKMIRLFFQRFGIPVLGFAVIFLILFIQKGFVHNASERDMSQTQESGSLINQAAEPDSELTRNILDEERPNTVTENKSTNSTDTNNTDANSTDANNIDINSENADSTEVNSTNIGNTNLGETNNNNPEDGNAPTSNLTPQQNYYTAQVTDHTRQLGEEIVSSNAILIDLSTDSILAQKDSQSIISPASMTKILTILVAAEHIQNLEDTFTITLDITDYCYVNDCSNVGFAENETVTVRDLFYGTILPSGADAAVGLATYVSGSQEAFVELMNEKLKELGLSETAHFTNCVGIYNENHYCTVYDMAVILKAAIENDFCREVLSAHTYTTTATQQHPEGIIISNWFLRRIEDKDTSGEVLCGKTGYVVQSGNCSASYALDTNGKGYICVTANATSAWRCIYDHVAIYKEFLPEGVSSE